MDLGTDIKMKFNGNTLPDAKSDFDDAKETDAIMQDIVNEAITYEGDLFYDEDYGWSLYDFIHASFGLDNILLETELKYRISTKLYKRKYIDSSSIQIDVSFANDICVCNIVFKFIEEEFERTIRITLDRVNLGVVAET